MLRDFARQLLAVHVYSFIHACVHTCMYVYIYTPISDILCSRSRSPCSNGPCHMYTRTHLRTYIHTDKHTFMMLLRRSRSLTCISRTCRMYVCIYIYTHTSTHIHTHPQAYPHDRVEKIKIADLYKRNVSYVYIHIHTSAYIHTHPQAYLHDLVEKIEIADLYKWNVRL